MGEVPRKPLGFDIKSSMKGRERVFNHKNLYMTIYSEADCELHISLKFRTERLLDLTIPDKTEEFIPIQKKDIAQVIKTDINKFSFIPGTVQNKEVQLDSLIKKLT